MLKEYREEVHYRGTVDKMRFPGMVKQVVDGTTPETIIAAFAKTGISPLNREKVIALVPARENVSIQQFPLLYHTTINAVFTDLITTSYVFRDGNIFYRKSINEL